MRMATGCGAGREPGNLRRGCLTAGDRGRWEDGRVTSILWYRRDLRVHDLPALAAAAEQGPVLPVFVLDERLLGGRRASANRTWFLLKSLRALDAALRERGTRLHIRRGRPEEVIPELALACGAGAVYVSRDYAPFGRRRDARTGRALSAVGVELIEMAGVLAQEPGDVLTAKGAPFTVFGPFRRRWESLPRRTVLPAPGRIARVDGIEPGELPPAGRSPAAIIEPGEAAARRRLDCWVDGGLAMYAEQRDFPASGGTSRLSQDLRWGLLSPVEVLERCAAAGPAGAKFAAEVAWRDFNHHLLWHHPRVLREPFQRQFAGMRWRDDTDALAAWKAGRTGFPLVDAGMRELLATGYMHNRVRMVCASFLAKQLLIDWRLGEAHFMEHLVDGDVANNNGGWQWSAGTGADAQPYFRVFNPARQAAKFDPGGEYLRRWVPELGRVPIRYLPEPHTMPPDVQREAACTIGRDYPAPIVDHRLARERAIAAFSAARRGELADLVDDQ